MLSLCLLPLSAGVALTLKAEMEKFLYKAEKVNILICCLSHRYIKLPIRKGTHPRLLISAREEGLQLDCKRKGDFFAFVFTICILKCSEKIAKGGKSKGEVIDMTVGKCLTGEV